MSLLLAACPDPAFRDGKKAISFSQRGVKLDRESWTLWAVHAMALAEVGEFEQAVSAQVKAVELLKATPKPDAQYLRIAEDRVELYKAKKPYREE